MIWETPFFRQDDRIDGIISIVQYREITEKIISYAYAIVLLLNFGEQKVEIKRKVKDLNQKSAE